MEYILKLKDQALTLYVTFQDSEITLIDLVSIIYTPDSPHWKNVKQYVEDLMIEQMVHYE
jgi:hypothetical protein